jgi:hypothetical protein
LCVAGFGIGVRVAGFARVAVCLVAACLLASGVRSGTAGLGAPGTAGLGAPGTTGLAATSTTGLGAPGTACLRATGATGLCAARASGLRTARAGIPGLCSPGQVTRVAAGVHVAGLGSA